jgi:AbrB family looped-hinge helix DNA binding protein
MPATTVTVRRKGVITLPVELRRQYDLKEGDALTLFDLGDGSFLLTPQVSRVDILADQMARLMADDGVTLEDILDALNQEREAYYRDHYDQA